MRTVQCHECRKQYDYDDDGFCPRCGAFNQPPRSAARMRTADARAVRPAAGDKHSSDQSWQDLGKEMRKLSRSLGKLLEPPQRNRRLPGGDL